MAEDTIHVVHERVEKLRIVDVNRRVRDRCRERGTTVRALSIELGYSPTYVQNKITGDSGSFPIKLWTELSEALEMTEEDWTRPFPKLERRPLAEIVRARGQEAAKRIKSEM